MDGDLRRALIVWALFAGTVTFFASVGLVASWLIEHVL